MGQIVLDSYAGVLIIKVLIGILSVLGVLGNTLVVLSVFRNRSMHTVMHYLLVNLSIADTLVAVFLLMRYTSADEIQYPHDLRADIICKFVSFATISWVGLHAQVFTLIVISFERYSAVVHPHSSRGRLTKRKLKVVLAACWMYAIGFIMPDFITIKYDVKLASCIYEWPEIIQKIWAFLWFFTCGPIPLFTMGFLYGRVVHKLWIQKEGRASESRKAVIQSRKRVTKVVITVTVIYAVCWLPNLILWLMSNFMKSIPYITFLITLTHVFLLFNSSVNPFVYSIQSQHFRTCMARTLYFWKPHHSVTEKLQDANTNTGSVQVRCGVKTRDKECQSSAVLEGRKPTGIIQSPRHSLEVKRRFSVIKADFHSNTVLPVTKVMGNDTSNHSSYSRSGIRFLENELLTIEKGFETTEEQTLDRESKGKNFGVFPRQVNECTAKVSGAEKEKEVLVNTEDRQGKSANYGGVWMGEQDKDRGDSDSQSTEIKKHLKETTRSVLLVKTLKAFAGVTADNKRDKIDAVLGWDPSSFLHNLKAKSEDNCTTVELKESYHNDITIRQEQISEENIETENKIKNDNEIESESFNLRIDESFLVQLNERNEDTDETSYASSSKSDTETQKGSKKSVFIELPDDTEPAEKFVLPRINQAGTFLVTVKSYPSENEQNMAIN